MSNFDHQPETLEPAENEVGQTEIDTVISGQKRLLYSILCYLCAAPVLVVASAFIEGTPENPVVTPEIFAMVVAGFLGVLAGGIGASTGIFRMGGVLYPGVSRYLYAVGVLVPIPLIGLIVMFSANSKATEYLRVRGFKIGLLGVKR